DTEASETIVFWFWLWTVTVDANRLWTVIVLIVTWCVNFEIKCNLSRKQFFPCLSACIMKVYVLKRFPTAAVAVIRRSRCPLSPVSPGGTLGAIGKQALLPLFLRLNSCRTQSLNLRTEHFLRMEISSGSGITVVIRHFCT
uniref:Secreted protein n=1 Tax=Mesocestoides corti TaxID=53468 RepID=A0A5K3FGE1_MESCO